MYLKRNKIVSIRKRYATNSVSNFVEKTAQFQNNEESVAK